MRWEPVAIAPIRGCDGDCQSRRNTGPSAPRAVSETPGNRRFEAPLDEPNFANPVPLGGKITPIAGIGGIFRAKAKRNRDRTMAPARAGMSLAKRPFLTGDPRTTLAKGFAPGSSLVYPETRNI